MSGEGLYAFCFTDIAGSTRLLRRLGNAAYDQVIERHRVAIRDALAGTTGEEVRAEGDGFFLAFPQPAEALSFAAEAQRRLAACEAT